MNNYTISIFGSRASERDYDTALAHYNNSVYTDGAVNFSKCIAAGTTDIGILKDYKVTCRESVVNTLFTYMNRIDFLGSSGYKIFLKVDMKENPDYCARSLYTALAKGEGKVPALHRILKHLGACNNYIKSYNGEVSVIFELEAYTSPINISAALLAARLVPYIGSFLTVNSFINSLFALVEKGESLSSHDAFFGIDRHGILALIVLSLAPEVPSRNWCFFSNGPLSYVTGDFFDSWHKLLGLSPERRKIFQDLSKGNWKCVRKLVDFFKGETE